jgi:hypothetical protein
VVNPAALSKGSAIYGMPILEAYKAKTALQRLHTAALEIHIVALPTRPDYDRGAPAPACGGPFGVGCTG